MAAPQLMTSRSARVKAARRLTRRAARASERLFLAEGPQAVREALRRPGCVVEVFVTPEAIARHGEIASEAAGKTTPAEWHQVDEAAMASLAGTRSPQGVVAVCRTLDVPLDQIAWPEVDLVAICANVRDPGNAGTVIRCADAAGADAVVLAGASVDPYNPKTVRATAGSLFHLAVVVTSSVEETVVELKLYGLVVLAADGGGDRSLLDLEPALLRQPTGWLFGNEAWGLPEELAALADHRVRIPIYGRAESLNLAAAAAVCLYESAREQHRPPPGGGVAER